MSGLLVLFQSTLSLSQWLATVIALALSPASPAPRHAPQQHHHQPVRLPELASVSIADPTR